MPLQNNKIKELYNNLVKEKYDNDYEFFRWHNNLRQALDYKMMYLAIKEALKDCDFSSVLELGPACGTWTKILFAHSPKAAFQLVDISLAMKEQFIKEMRMQENINYQVEDFLNFEEKIKYDFFFSSRAIEYFSDKEAAISKIFKCLKEKGRGIIITKNPNFRPGKGRDKRFQHSGQIDENELIKMLSETGFKNIKSYPVVVRRTFLDKFNLRFSEKTFEKIYKKEFEKGFDRFTECYLIKFEK